MKNLISYAVVLILLSVNVVFAQWPHDLSVNLPLCTQTNDQTEPQTISDGSGGAIILWTDKRSGDWDIYAQRVSQEGQILWQSDGIPIVGGRGDQTSPEIVSNGNGGAYITWKSNGRIYAQQIDANGNFLWNQAILLSSSTVQQSAYDISYDLNGGFVAAWVTSESFNALLAQRVDNQGQLLWGENGKLVYSSEASHDPKICATSNGGAVIFYEQGWVFYIYYVMILDQNGNKKISDQGTNIGPRDGRHDLVSDGLGGAIVTWEHDYEIYANRVDNGGNKLWGSSGIVVCTAGTDKYMPFITSDNNHGAYIFWHDYTNYYSPYSYCDIYAQHLNSSGQKLWAVDGLQVSNSDIHEWIGSVKTDDQGGVIVSWETNNKLGWHWWYTSHDSAQNVWVQKISSLGDKAWSGGFQISTNSAKKYSISAIGDGSGGIIAAWVDRRNGDADIYAQGLTYSSTVTGISGNITDATTSNPIAGAKLVLSGPASDSTWSDSNGDYQFLTPAGTGYAIEVSSFDYHTAKKENITVVDGETTVVDFALHPDLHLNPPTNLQATVSSAKVSLQWQAPVTTTEEELSFDDGSFENSMGWDNLHGIAANGPFRPSKYPALIKVAKIAFNGQRAGDQFKVYVYLDPSGMATKPSSSLLAGTVGPFSISNTGTFQNVDLTSLNLNLSSGEFFIGVQQLGSQPMWILLDESGSGNNSSIDSNLDGIFTSLPNLNPPQSGVFAIRAIVSIPGSLNQVLVANDSKSSGKKNTTKFFKKEKIGKGNLADSGFLTLSNRTGRKLTRNISSPKWENSAPSSNLIGYNIYRSLSSSVALTQENRIATVSQSSTNYDDTAIAAGQTYYYVVTAVYDVGESTASNEVSATVPQGPGSVVRIEPASKEIQKNSSGRVNVVIDSVQNLGSFEFTIEYDPSVVQISHNDSVKLGQFLGSTGRSVTPVGPVIDNVNGEVTFGAFTFGSSSAPSIDRGGVLATISWSAQDSGSCTLNFKEVKLTHPDGSSIANIRTINGQIRVTSCFWADIDCDGDVDIVDIQLVAGKWNTKVGDPNYDPRCDVDNQGQGDGDIDIVDIQLVAGWWNKILPGSSCSQLAKDENQGLGNLTLGLKPGGTDSKGNTILDVTVDNVQNLGAFQFDLVNSNGLLEVQEVKLGDLVKRMGDNVVRVGPEIDKASKGVTFGVYSYGDKPGASGKGVLARIILKSRIAVGQTVSLENIRLTDHQGNLLPVNKTVTTTEMSDFSKVVLPDDFTLRQNYPNPFNPRTTISFGIPNKIGKSVKVRLNIFNLEGKLVKTLLNEEKPAGWYIVEWNGTNEIGEKVSSGIYFYTVQAGDYSATRKMLLTK